MREIYNINYKLQILVMAILNKSISVMLALDAGRRFQSLDV